MLTGVLCWRLSQLVGVVCASATSACATYAVLMLIKMTVGVDITWEEEDAGLDKSQIGETGAVGVQLGCSCSGDTEVGEQQTASSRQRAADSEQQQR